MPSGGVHVWIELPANGSDAVEAAHARGVAINAGDGYFAAEPAGSFVRLSFGAAADLAELAEGARRIAAGGARKARR